MNNAEAHAVKRAIATELLTMLDQGITVKGTQDEYDRLRRIGWQAIVSDESLWQYAAQGNEEAFVQNRVSEYITLVLDIYAEHYRAHMMECMYGPNDGRWRDSSDALTGMRDNLVSLARTGADH